MTFNVIGYDKSENEIALPKPFWLEYESSIKTPADSLKLTFFNKTIPNVVMIKVEGDLNFFGIVDTIKHYSQNKRCEITLRSIAAALLDSEATPGTFKNPKLETVFSNCACNGYIKGILYNSYTPISEMTVSKGTSLWKYLTDFCEITMGYVPHIDENLYISAKPYDENIVHTFELEFPLNVEKSVDYTKVISSSSVRNNLGNYSVMLTNSDMHLPYGRHRYLIPDASGEGDLIKYGRKILRQSMRDYNLITLTFPHFYKARVGDGATFDGEEKCVFGVKHILSNEGATTKITLGERAYIY